MGNSCFLDVFFVKEKPKREIADQYSGKSTCNRTTIFTKWNGFFIRYSVFFNRFLVKIRIKREISGRFLGKDHNRTTIFAKCNGF